MPKTKVSSPDVLVLSYLESFLCNSNEIIFSSLNYYHVKLVSTPTNVFVLPPPTHKLLHSVA